MSSSWDRPSSFSLSIGQCRCWLILKAGNIGQWQYYELEVYVQCRYFHNKVSVDDTWMFYLADNSRNITGTGESILDDITNKAKIPRYLVKSASISCTLQKLKLKRMANFISTSIRKSIDRCLYTSYKSDKHSRHSHAIITVTCV